MYSNAIVTQTWEKFEALTIGKYLNKKPIKFEYCFFKTVKPEKWPYVLSIQNTKIKKFETKSCENEIIFC